MRHAHAETKEQQPDAARNLDDIGWKEATEMGDKLRQAGIFPDLIISSQAMRALQTAQTIAESVGYNVKNIQIEEDIYRVAADDVLHLLQEQDDKYKVVLLTGHNPTISELATMLSTDIKESMVPACMHIFEGDANSWAHFREHPVKLVHSMQPKQPSA